MAIKDIIRQRRKHLGLTQEQLADALCVSVAAVSKWETGKTNPDTTLLVPLARHLRVDLNTLLEYSQNISNEMLEQVCVEVTELAKTDGIGTAFNRAEQVLHEFPYDDHLLHSLTLILDGLLKLYGNETDRGVYYAEYIQKRYLDLSKSSDPTIQNSALYMIANTYIDEGDFLNAREVLDRMRDQNDMHSLITDKRLLEIKLNRSKGDHASAAAMIQHSLFVSLHRVQLLLCQLVQSEIDIGEVDRADRIAKLSKQLSCLCELDDAQYCASYLIVSQALQDAEMGLHALEKLLESVQNPVFYENTLLFSRIKSKPGINLDGQMVSMLLQQIAEDSSLAYLRNTDSYKNMMERWNHY